MVLKIGSDQPVWPVKPEIGLQYSPVMVKTENNLKIGKIRKPAGSIREPGTGMVEPVNDRLGFVEFSGK